MTATETPPLNNSPAEVVAIARAARITGDRQLEKAARRELISRFGICIQFPPRGKGGRS